MDLELLAEGLDHQVILQLKAMQYTLTTVESLTGGLAGAVLTTVPGASSVFKGGFVTYCNKAKHEMAGVSEAVLEAYGAVSKEAAEEMARGGVKATGSNVCVSFTGNAGPAGEEGKPVGLVYIGCCVNGKTTVQEYLFQGDRMKVRAEAVREGLRLILACLNR